MTQLIEKKAGCAKMLVTPQASLGTLGYTLLFLLLAACSSGDRKDSSKSQSEASEGTNASDKNSPNNDGASAAQTDPEGDPDGDGIINRYEGTADEDSDGDGLVNQLDEDSDGDGISDAVEAAITSQGAKPADSDEDGIFDFLDADSDNDGLSDALEFLRGLNPLKKDSDDDGVDDLVEYSAGTNPIDATDNPIINGNFFFRVPYQESPDPPEGALIFEPEVTAADVYFLMDSSVSMAEELLSLQNNMTDIIIPGLQENIADLQVGAGEFDTCPNNQNSGKDGAGEYKNIGIRNLQQPTDDADAVRDSLEDTFSHDASGQRTKPEGGPDEPFGPAMWLWATGDHTFGTGDIDAQVATNAGYDPLTDDPVKGLMAPNCAEDRLGFGCIRDKALPVLVLIGDEPYNEGDKCDAHIKKTPEEVGAALNEIGAKIVVMGTTANENSGGYDRRAPYETIANLTGSVDAEGEALIFATKSSEFKGEAGAIAVRNAIETLTEQTPLTLRAVPRDIEGDDVDATLFIERIEADGAGEKADPRDALRVCLGGLTTSNSGAGYQDTFEQVVPGTPVCFTIVVARNEIVEPTAEAQVFRAAIDVVDPSGSRLDTRTVFFLVPPRPPMIGDPVIR